MAVCIPSGIVPCFGGVPARLYIIRGSKVTWEVLAEYVQSPAPSGLGSFLVRRLVLLIFG